MTKIILIVCSVFWLVGVLVPDHPKSIIKSDNIIIQTENNNKYEKVK